MRAAIEWSIIICVLTAILIVSFFYDASQRDERVAEHAKAIQKQMEEENAKHEAVPPNFVLTPDGAEITEDFYDSSVVKLIGVELCPESKSPDFTSSYSCHDNQCATIVNFGDKPIPKQLAISRKYNGSCIKQTLQDIEQYQIWIKDVTFNQTVAKQLQISEATKVQKTATSKFDDVSVKKDGKNIVISIEYQVLRPQEDEFKAGSKVVQMLYNLKSTHRP